MAYVGTVEVLKTRLLRMNTSLIERSRARGGQALAYHHSGLRTLPRAARRAKERQKASQSQPEIHYFLSIRCIYSLYKYHHWLVWCTFLAVITLDGGQGWARPRIIRKSEDTLPDSPHDVSTL
ncbi:hypothetical protein KCU88_g288, partial [Aureobasidium melanogenum]